MYKSSDFTKPVYKTGEIMEILNISYSTIKVYDNLPGSTSFSATMSDALI